MSKPKQVYDKSPEFKDGELTEQEKTEHYQTLANELASVMQEGIYPMDIISFMWKVLETALERNDVGFNHVGYTEVVIPYLLTVDPEFESAIVCMTETLKNLQAQKNQIKNEPTVLDLSNQTTDENECIDLAKNLSAALNNPQIPTGLKITIANGISDLIIDDSEFISVLDSPEYIAKVLCQQGGNNEL